MLDFQPAFPFQAPEGSTHRHSSLKAGFLSFTSYHFLYLRDDRKYSRTVSLPFRSVLLVVCH